MASYIKICSKACHDLNVVKFKLRSMTQGTVLSKRRKKGNPRKNVEEIELKDKIIGVNYHTIMINNYTKECLCKFCEKILLLAEQAKVKRKMGVYKLHLLADD